MGAPGLLALIGVPRRLVAGSPRQGRSRQCGPSPLRGARACDPLDAPCHDVLLLLATGTRGTHSKPALTAHYASIGFRI